jgi:putative glutamine amidotransferase
VAVMAGSRLHDMLASDRITVNSMHHQGIKTLAPGLVASATAPDGLVEAVELPDAPFCVGVQWHPEVFEMANPDTRRVFREFIAAATRYRGA